MKNNRKDEGHADDSRLGRSTSDLRGKQSVRATFRLSEECIDAISIIAAHLGIKQKSIFDHLMEDQSLLNEIARRVENSSLNRTSRIQKTFVVSRKSLYVLDEISTAFNAPRDALVEYSVQRLLPIIAKEREKHENRKKVFAQMKDHFSEGEKLLSTAKKLLGNDDPVYGRFEAVMAAYKNARDHIEVFVEKGKIIEKFAPSLPPQPRT